MIDSVGIRMTADTFDALWKKAASQNPQGLVRFITVQFLQSWIFTICRLLLIWVKSHLVAKGQIEMCPVKGKIEMCPVKGKIEICLLKRSN